MRQAARAIVIRDGNILLIHRNKFGKEYFTLPGGGIEPGESAEQTLARELVEECSMRLVSARHVFTESVSDMLGVQFMYLCEVEGDTPRLQSDSTEAKLNAMGQNLYTPLWYPLDDFAHAAFRTPLLHQAILLGAVHGFPAEPIVLDSQFMEQIQSKLVLQKKG